MLDRVAEGMMEHRTGTHDSKEEESDTPTGSYSYHPSRNARNRPLGLFPTRLEGETALPLCSFGRSHRPISSLSHCHSAYFLLLWIPPLIATGRYRLMIIVMIEKQTKTTTFKSRCAHWLEEQYYRRSSFCLLPSDSTGGAKQTKVARYIPKRNRQWNPPAARTLRPDPESPRGCARLLDSESIRTLSSRVDSARSPINNPITESLASTPDFSSQSRGAIEIDLSRGS
eukprot:GHVU01142450.1.p1 GENE.GHVU01142450.1~~GHVU01142450.1.p1  ORF type:complete len:228 (-),score=10.80 GHVU01142450.1:766-1449(-)